MEPDREPLPTRVRDTPALPDDYEHALDRGLVQLGLALDTDARAAIDGHVRLLLAWTNAINLTAIRDPAGVATAHVIDSLSVVSWFRARDAGHGIQRIVDLGSGGGFPGLPIAAAWPGAAVTLLEPIRKKAAFLQTAVDAAGLADRVAVVAGRAEALAAEPAQRGTWSVVTARAVASAADLVELAFPLLEPGGVLVAWKRGDLRAELAAARRAVDALGGGALEVRDVAVDGLDGHRLVTVRRTGRVPDAYPRDPAARRRRPW
ncbi:MAG: rRNA (guanine527-N7)-methyltransferase [Chloroflexota bacterium]|nr:rRNA (guanine527-N7)-methyltransferase [Chloroflexota bacterium]